MFNFKIQKTVYFVRHGESVDNSLPVYQGPDSPLSEKGKMQAHSIAERAAKLSFESLIASPYPRTRATAEAIASVTGQEIEFSELFIERVKPTSINGKPYTDEVATTTWLAWNRSLTASGIRVEDGENYDDLIKRVDSALDFLAERPEETIMVVTHGYFLRALVARVLLGDLLTDTLFHRIRHTAGAENTAMTVIQYCERDEGKLSWRLYIYNDHAHL